MVTTGAESTAYVNILYMVEITSAVLTKSIFSTVWFGGVGGVGGTERDKVGHFNSVSVGLN